MKLRGLGSTIAPPRFVGFMLLMIAAVGAAALWLPIGHALMTGFDIAASVFLLSLIPLMQDRTADQMRAASKNNDANRVLLLVITSVVIVAILVSVAAELGATKSPEMGAVALVILTLALAWLFSNMVYALHYAHLFYSREAGKDADCGGLDVPGTDEPDYWDFVYFAFTLGMTFQTSDVTINAPHMRKIVVFHCLAAFVFNIGVLAFTINVLGS